MIHLIVDSTPKGIEAKCGTRAKPYGFEWTGFYHRITCPACLGQPIVLPAEPLFTIASKS